MSVSLGCFRRWIQTGIRKSRFLPLLILYTFVTFFLKEQLYGNVWKRLSTQTVLESDIERKLCLIQVLFRHGHRSPFKLYPTDPNPADFWKEGMGQLTMLGKLQHFAVGEHLRQWYSDFLSMNPLEVNCLSSGAQRCRYGASALLAAMYPPSIDKMIDDYLLWQPIPVDYNPEYNDKWLQSTATCPTSENERKAIQESSPEANAYIQKYKHLYDFWGKKSGLNIAHFEHASSLYKTLRIQKSLNLTVPDWALETWDDLVVQGGISYYFNFRTKLIQRLRAGPLIELVLQRMRNKMQNPQHPKNVYLYSGHGSNIAALLMAFGLFDNQMPPYTSFVTFELYKTATTNFEYLTDQYSVRLLYTNCSVPEESVPPPNILVLPGCTEYCPFEYLERFTRPMIPDDWETECNRDQRKKRRL